MWNDRLLFSILVIMNKSKIPVYVSRYMNIDQKVREFGTMVINSALLPDWIIYQGCIKKYVSGRKI